MRVDEILEEYGPKPEVGRLIWDSETGELAGDAAPRVAEAIARAIKQGGVGVGPQYWCDYPVSDPLHRPAEMAAVLAYYGFRIPAALMDFYPEVPDDEDVPDDAAF